MPIANTNAHVRQADGSIAIITRLGDRFLIDRSDLCLAARHCWSRHEHGYARAVTRDAEGRQRTVYLHRLICATSQLQPHVDHVNGDVADCRRGNLRACTRSENLRNQKRRADNTSGFKGVGLHKQSGLYRARVRANGKTITVGLFRSPDKASEAVIEQRERLHGEFARHE